jgi:hypothetical protein
MSCLHNIRATVFLQCDSIGAIARALAANERGIPAVLDFVVARARMQQTYEHYAFYGRG